MRVGISQQPPLRGRPSPSSDSQGFMSLRRTLKCGGARSCQELPPPLHGRPAMLVSMHNAANAKQREKIAELLNMYRFVAMPSALPSHFLLACARMPDHSDCEVKVPFGLEPSDGEDEEESRTGVVEQNP